MKSIKIKKTSNERKMLLKQSLNETNINERYEIYKCAIYDYSNAKYHNVAIVNNEENQHRIKAVHSVTQDKICYEDTEEYLILKFAIRDFKLN